MDEINKLISDSDFKARLDAANNEDEVRALFLEKGIEVDINDAEESELDESSLENVTGGIKLVSIWLKWKNKLIGIPNNISRGGGGRGF